MIIIWVGHVTDMIRLISCSDNYHTMTLEEVIDGGSSLIKNTVYVMTALNGRVLIGHSMSPLFHNCDMA
jgi:hypothetical protein